MNICCIVYLILFYMFGRLYSVCYERRCQLKGCFLFFARQQQRCGICL